MTSTAPCPYCQIARGEAPAHKVFESARMLAFLDDRPLFPGHLLLIPREHYETLRNLPAQLAPAFFQIAQGLARAVEGAMASEGSLVAVNNVVNQNVPHLHIHIVPRRQGDGLQGFFWPRQPYHDDSEPAAIAAKIRAEIAKMRGN